MVADVNFGIAEVVGVRGVVQEGQIGGVWIAQRPDFCVGLDDHCHLIVGKACRGIGEPEDGANYGACRSRRGGRDQERK